MTVSCHCFRKQPAPKLVIAVINSNITAIAAELVAEQLKDVKVMAISRRGCLTTLPLVGDGETLEKQFVPRSIRHSLRQIRAFDRFFEALAGGEPFDALICHSADPLSQMLMSHPLCRKFYYIEEGLTASVGKRLGRRSKRFTALKRRIWMVKSYFFYRNRFVKYSPHFYETSSRKYGGAYALSLTGFAGFPGRVQLPFHDLPSTGDDPQAEVLILTDSQYFIGGCSYEEYKRALLDCVRQAAPAGARIAIKFHPGERTTARKEDLQQALAELPGIVSVKELPSAFIAERMVGDSGAIVIVGTTALGLYMGSRGFRTITFARRLHGSSPKITAFIDDIPKVFFDVCEEG